MRNVLINLGLVCAWAGGAEAIAAGSYYSSAGGSSSTCLIAVCPYSSCGDGKYLAGCATSNPGACTGCTNTIPYQKRYSSYGDALGECPTAFCDVCPRGQKRVDCGTGLDKTSTGSCISCGTPPAGQAWAPNTGVTSDCPVIDKVKCDAGSYNLGASDISEGSCTACSGLQQYKYWMTPTAWDTPCTQLSQTTCEAGYKSSLITFSSTTSAGTCSLCPALTNNGFYYGPNANPLSDCPTLSCSDEACAIGQFVKDCGTVSPFTSNGTCTKCTNAPSPTQVYTSKGGWTGTCEVGGCSTTPCTLGQYMDGCGGLPTATQCRNCANAVVGTSFYVTPIGYSSTCPTQNCQTCNAGYYTKGCTVLADGTCDACNN
jgi:hypothetical protein